MAYTTIREVDINFHSERFKVDAQIGLHQHHIDCLVRFRSVSTTVVELIRKEHKSLYLQGNYSHLLVEPSQPEHSPNLDKQALLFCYYYQVSTAFRSEYLLFLYDSPDFDS